MYVAVVGDRATYPWCQEYYSCPFRDDLCRVFKDFANVYHGHAWHDKPCFIPE